MATKTLLTWEQFEQLPDDAMHYELLDGELITLPPPKSGHSTIAHTIRDALSPYVIERGLGRVYVEAGYRLSTDPGTWVQPDVSFLRAERLSSTRQDQYFEGAPDLAVEVISPSESAHDVNRKTRKMLAAGARAVWVVYPETREAHISRNGSAQALTERDTISEPDLFPGWQFPVAKFFAD